MRSHFLPLVAVLLAPMGATAAPMPFYKWQSKVDGAFTCQQTSPGHGWTKIGGPFRDAGCREALPQTPPPKGLAVPKVLKGQ
ncbi:hypothetical protein HNP46_001497 [Pseudomonas nitritireducens]|uniref:DUF4124 domain-containing protein n=1 Tax=Pseudomonas nitroreducens TaxID=46680 RepID=A0A7W7KIC8_PSENT|nr:hypothetical protein [Pseudomonas nitritireducens]MBB4862653.1 hypothetical protein [Pseudomonas nitritireducens]